MSEFLPVHPEMVDKFDLADDHITVIRSYKYQCRYCGWIPSKWGCIPKLEKHLLEKHGINGKSLWICAKTHKDFVRKIEQLQAIIIDVTNEMTKVDKLTGLEMRENCWKEKLLEAI